LNTPTKQNKITICVLLYGDYPALATRCINSIRDNSNRDQYTLIVGMNECCEETTKFVNTEIDADVIIHSKKNIGKDPMMRRMFQFVETQWMWWFDDDSYITDKQALSARLELIEKFPNVSMFGHMFFFGSQSNFNYGTDIKPWIKEQPWYKGRPLPCGVSSYLPDFNVDGNDDRWFFITGGSWIADIEVLRKLDFPQTNLLKRNDDVILAEMFRQNDYVLQDCGAIHMKINDAPRRGIGEDAATFNKQFKI
jgi:hypothetical protein